MYMYIYIYIYIYTYYTCILLLIATRKRGKRGKHRTIRECSFSL